MAEETQTPRRRRLGLKLLLALFIGLATVEVGVRVIDATAKDAEGNPRPRTAAFWLPPASRANELFNTHPYMGYLYRPGAQRRKASDGSGQNVTINSRSMRGEELLDPKPPGTYRIFCVGGSTTFGTGVTSDELTYPERLEHYLNEMAPEGVTYEVANCGVNGYNSIETLINLELRLVEFEPDAVIVYHAANDARPIQARGFQPDYAHMRRSWMQFDVAPLERFLLSNWRTYCWVTRGLDPSKQLSDLGNPIFVPGFEDLHIRSDERVNTEGVDVFFRNLRHIALVARENGIQPVFCTFATCPENQRNPREDFLQTVNEMNARLPAFCAEVGAPLLDIAKGLDGKCRYYTDWMHLNDEGSDAHGRLAAEEARRLGLFGLGG